MVGLPPRCPQVVWCHWGEIEAFSAMLAQDGLAECDQLRRRRLLNPAHGEDRQWAIPLSYHGWFSTIPTITEMKISLITVGSIEAVHYIHIIFSLTSYHLCGHCHRLLKQNHSSVALFCMIGCPSCHQPSSFIQACNWNWLTLVCILNVGVMKLLANEFLCSHYQYVLIRWAASIYIPNQIN